MFLPYLASIPFEQEVKAEVERALAPALALLQATLQSDLAEAKEAVIDDCVEEVRQDVSLFVTLPARACPSLL